MTQKTYTAKTLISHSPRKTRLIINPIRNIKLDKALLILQAMNKPKAKKITLLLKSAASNMALTEGDYAGYTVSHIVAEETGIMYRMTPRGKGSSTKIRRRQCNIKVLLTPNVA
jgi:large subunit ribosomal protein L22